MYWREVVSLDKAWQPAGTWFSPFSSSLDQVTRAWALKKPTPWATWLCRMDRPPFQKLAEGPRKFGRWMSSFVDRRRRFGYYQLPTWNSFSPTRNRWEAKRLPECFLVNSRLPKRLGDHSYDTATHCPCPTDREVNKGFAWRKYNFDTGGWICMSTVRSDPNIRHTRTKTSNKRKALFAFWSVVECNQCNWKKGHETGLFLSTLTGFISPDFLAHHGSQVSLITPFKLEFLENFLEFCAKFRAFFLAFRGKS